MVGSDPCLQGFDSGCLKTLRPFYHLRTSTGGLIIVKTSRNKHSVPFLTHIQAVNSRQNIQDIAQDSESQMFRNNLATQLELSLKSRDGTHAFRNVFVLTFDKSTFFQTETETQATQRIRNTQYQTASQDRKSRVIQSKPLHNFTIFVFCQLQKCWKTHESRPSIFRESSSGVVRSFRII